MQGGQPRFCNQSSSSFPANTRLTSLLPSITLSQGLGYTNQILQLIALPMAILYLQGFLDIHEINPTHPPNSKIDIKKKKLLDIMQKYNSPRQFLLRAKILIQKRLQASKL